MENTYGIFLLNKDKILIGHPTHSPANGWTIPKGRAEPGETPTQAAIREFKEEAGYDLEPFKDLLVPLGTEIYLSKKKQIHAFLLKVNEEFPEAKCTSLVTDKGEPFFPEIDRFQWATFDEAFNLVFGSQKELMNKNKDKFFDTPRTQVDLEVVKKAIEHWILPDERGKVRGYGGKHPGNGWSPESWSDGHDFQNVALDIWNRINKKNA